MLVRLKNCMGLYTIWRISKLTWAFNIWVARHNIFKASFAKISSMNWGWTGTTAGPTLGSSSTFHRTVRKRTPDAPETVQGSLNYMQKYFNQVQITGKWVLKIVIKIIFIIYHLLLCIHYYSYFHFVPFSARVKHHSHHIESHFFSYN